MMKLKPNKMLNGIVYRYNKDREFNKIQQDHIKGLVDVYAPLAELNGASIAQVWREAFNRRINVKSTRNR